MRQECMVVHHAAWWCMVVHGGASWCVTVVCNSSLIRCDELSGGRAGLMARLIECSASLQHQYIHTAHSTEPPLSPHFLAMTLCSLLMFSISELDMVLAAALPSSVTPPLSRV
ncbi:hypothetical protein Q8A73_019351 [Channa argus]|nr:hypothetical protein Q8A73_019351 [Channa argus]